LFLVGVSTEPARVSEATDQLRHQLRRLAEEEPTINELDRTRRMLIGQRAMGLQRAISRATDLAVSELFGVAHGVSGYADGLKALEAGAVAETLSRRGALDPVEVVVLPETGS